MSRFAAYGYWTDQGLATGMYLGSTVQARLDDVIREVASGLSPVVGEEFFHSLVMLLGDAMGVDHVFVAELDYVDHDRANLVALSGREQLSTPLSLKIGRAHV